MPRQPLLRPATAGLALALAFAAPAAAPAFAGDSPAGGFGAVAAELLPSVVSVYVRAAVSKSGDNSQGKVQFASQASQGSGFIIDPAGYIVTNRHVIENAYAITVVMEDQRMLRATLIGKLNRMDLALLKIDAGKPLPAVKFGDSGKMKPGDAVLAIGNPLGLGGSVTAGVVSALNRNIGETPFDDYIQVDAAINHGNSGGPLFNAAGELVGVNTAFFSPGTGSGGSVGLGFAIPSNDVAWVMNQIRTKHKLTPGWVDMQVQSVSDEIGEAFGHDAAGGAIVVGLKPNSIAMKAGVKQGDIVLSFNNEPVGDVRALARAVAKTDPGTTAAMQVWRGGKMITLSVPVVLYTGDGGINGIPPDVHDAAVAQGLQAPHLGVKLVMLTDAQRRKWGMAAAQKGVLIDSVVPFSIADNHVVRPGEVIVSVMDTPVSTPDEVYKLVADLKAKGANHVAFLVGNDNGTRWVALPFIPGSP